MVIEYVKNKVMGMSVMVKLDVLRGVSVMYVE